MHILFPEGKLYMPKRGKQFRSKSATRRDLSERRMTRNIDKLAEFEVFDKQVMPNIKKMVLENWSPERIRKHFAPLMQGLMIQKGICGNFAAIKDVLDRHEGTAVQRLETKTLYGKMSKKELAALALQKLHDSGIIDVTGKVVRKLPPPDEQ